MRLKELEAALQPLQGFDQPKPLLEQYVTSAHLASQMLFSALSYGDIEDCSVLDLGCGCGILAIGARICGAEYVLGADIDQDALAIARTNLQEMELEYEVDLVKMRIQQDSIAVDRFGRIFDTVIMNPPFGTKTEGVDAVFLELACKIAENTVYTLHKSSTRDFIQRKARSFGFQGQVVAQMRYDLPKTMRFHKHKTKDIEVDFWRFTRIGMT